MAFPRRCLPLPNPRIHIGEMFCEDLPSEYCAFAISSSGKRCILEHYTNTIGVKEYQCKTSEVMVERMSEYIETDECVRACVIDRNMVGISSDALLEIPFLVKLCSPPCYLNCHNIVHLYFNLAVGEGESLPSMCQNPRHFMVGLMSYGPSPLGAPLPSFVGSPF